MSRQLAKAQKTPSPASPTHAPALREARFAMYRRHVLEVAEHMFAERGEAGTKMQDVAAAASISLATLYAAFPKKTALYQAIVAARGDELLSRVTETIHALRREGAPPLTVMLRGMTTHLRFFMDHPSFLKMNLLEGHAWYHGAARPSLEQEDHWARGARLLEGGFALGQKKGLIVPEDPVAQARTMVALQQTRLAGWVLDGMRAAPDDVIAAVQAEYVRTFCRPSVAAGLLVDDGTRLEAHVLTERPRARGRA